MMPRHRPLRNVSRFADGLVWRKALLRLTNALFSSAAIAKKSAGDLSFTLQILRAPAAAPTRRSTTSSSSVTVRTPSSPRICEQQFRENKMPTAARSRSAAHPAPAVEQADRHAAGLPLRARA
jgi:hypothetical protein